MTVQVLEGDALHLLRAMDDCSVDAVVTDPPYGLSQHKPDAIANVLAAWVSGDRDATLDGKGFMGKAWDAFVPPPALWDEVLRVLKPGGHACVFAGSRTVDLMGLSLRLAGFELRDTVEWLYATGFPKSLDVSKAIDKRGGSIPWQREFADHLRAVKPKDVTASQINAHVATNGSKSNFWGHFIDTTSQPLLPTVEQYRRLRELLPIDASWDEQFLPEAERDVVARRTSGVAAAFGDGRWATIEERKQSGSSEYDVTTAATDAARQWEGWGTALKPAHEPVLVARKPLSGTVAGNVLEWGTGALNIDGCRVGTDEDTRRNAAGGDNGLNGSSTFKIRERRAVDQPERAGRWPANVVLDSAAADALDQQSGVTISKSGGSSGTTFSAGVLGAPRQDPRVGHDDTGGASRFFTRADYGPDDWPFVYCAKPSRRERNAGLDGLPEKEPPGTKRSAPAEGRQSAVGAPRANHHPTVKPVALMRHLVRLVTPPGGTVLDPFTGSGTTLVAATHEHVNAIGCEIDPDYATIARARVRHAQAHTPEPDVPEPPAAGQHPTLPGV